MSSDDNPICDRCGGATVYAGRISLPAQQIYDCQACGRQMWVAIGTFCNDVTKDQLQQQRPANSVIGD
jgi:tRNA(Ile2) C34 agmatinyltransferase TiaS